MHRNKIRINGVCEYTEAYLISFCRLASDFEKDDGSVNESSGKDDSSSENAYCQKNKTEEMESTDTH